MMGGHKLNFLYKVYIAVVTVMGYMMQHNVSYTNNHAFWFPHVLSQSWVGQDRLLSSAGRVSIRLFAAWEELTSEGVLSSGLS